MTALDKDDPAIAIRDVLREVERRIEAARNEHWQQHLRDHPLADGSSCPRDYGIHDAYAAAANIVRDLNRRPGQPAVADHEPRPTPPGRSGTADHEART